MSEKKIESDKLSQSEIQALLGKLFDLALQQNASDIHLRAGAPPAFRQQNGLIPLEVSPMTDEDILEVCKNIVKNPAIFSEIESLKELDGSFEVKGVARVRFNIFRHQGRLGVVFRLIPKAISTLDKLGHPKVLKDLSQSHSGLILVTGATGSGKSTTLAAMIDYINSNKHCHIITVEDPVEYIHQSKKSQITQREVGPDTDNFVNALRASLRQDPDVILIGEMRDTETMEVALKASETGHLVFSTVHTTDAEKTIGRVIAMFPPEEQKSIRLRLSQNLKAIISQRLVPRADENGKVAALEIMVNTIGIQEAIADPERVSEIYDFIAKEHDIYGSQSFDFHLMKLYQDNIISKETALAHASSPNDFELSLTFDEDATSKNLTSNDNDLEIEHTAKLSTIDPENRSVPKEDKTEIETEEKSEALSLVENEVVSGSKDIELNLETDSDLELEDKSSVNKLKKLFKAS